MKARAGAGRQGSKKHHGVSRDACKRAGEEGEGAVAAVGDRDGGGKLTGWPTGVPDGASLSVVRVRPTETAM